MCWWECGIYTVPASAFPDTWLRLFLGGYDGRGLAQHTLTEIILCFHLIALNSISCDFYGVGGVRAGLSLPCWLYIHSDGYLDQPFKSVLTQLQCNIFWLGSIFFGNVWTALKNELHAFAYIFHHGCQYLTKHETTTQLASFCSRISFI